METEKNRHKSSNCDSYVTCGNVRCFFINYFGIELEMRDLFLVHIELPGKLLNYFFRRGKSNINQEVWFDQGFVIWYFLQYCLEQIVSFWSISIGVRIISTSNELVDRIWNLKSNASQNDRVEDSLCRPDSLWDSWNSMRRRQELSNKRRHRPEFLIKYWRVVCPIDIICNSFFASHSSASSFFNEFINSSINYSLAGL